jgi:hypothetical protein
MQRDEKGKEESDGEVPNPEETVPSVTVTDTSPIPPAGTVVGMIEVVVQRKATDERERARRKVRLLVFRWFHTVHFSRYGFISGRLRLMQFRALHRNEVRRKRVPVTAFLFRFER